MRIDEHYRRRHPRSQELYEHARGLFPSGVTHDGRWMEPYPITVEYAEGAYKWDVDGNRLIDYWQGHGALLLGHAYPPVVHAIQQQAARGTHFGANSRFEIAWAEQVKQCFPHIEQLRFTGSGTESTMLALRLARAFTGKPSVVRLLGHFHGWNDAPRGRLRGRNYDAGGRAGGRDSRNGTRSRRSRRDRAGGYTRDDLAAIIMEPSGASYGVQPLPDSFIQAVRQFCTEHGRAADLRRGRDGLSGSSRRRAGACRRSGRPDLFGENSGRRTTRRRGRRTCRHHGTHLAFGDAAWNEQHKIRHQGTFNANPLSAAAGIVTLEEVRTGAPQVQANRCRRPHFATASTPNFALAPCAAVPHMAMRRSFTSC